eukprot:gene9488-9298_t
MAEFKRQDLVYEKEDLLISGPGKNPDYNFYRVAGMAIAGKPKGSAQNEAEPINQERVWLKPGIWGGPVALAALLLVELLYVLFSHQTGEAVGHTTVDAKAVGISLFGPYLLVVELASMLLLAAAHGLAVAGILFCLGLVGLMVRRNILFVLMSLEVMMNASALAFIVAGSHARMNLLYLTFVFPLIGFLLLSFSRGRLSENLSALIGVGSVGLSAIVAAYVIWQFNVAPPEGGHYTLVLWQWMAVEGFTPNFALYLDGLSLTMLGVVVGVGFLIHLFASWYMRGEAGHGISHWLPLSVLIILSTFVGAMITPPLAGVLPQSVGHAGGDAKHSLEIASGAIAIAGILLAAMLFLGKRRFVTAVANSGIGRFLSAWWFAAWGFDWIYDKLFVKPYLAISHVLRKDPLDQTIGLIPRAAKAGHTALSRTETGQLRWYAASMAAGAVLVIGAIVVVAPVMILPWLILIPFIGGLLCWMGERFGATLPRWIALLTMSLELALGLWLWAHGDYSFAPAPGVDPTFALEFKHVWIERFGINVHLALDGLSLLMILLTGLLGILSVLCSWKEIERHVGFFHLNLMWILGGVVGVFLALDLFMFFFFWEMMLVPMYFLI